MLFSNSLVLFFLCIHYPFITVFGFELSIAYKRLFVVFLSRVRVSDLGRHTYRKFMGVVAGRNYDKNTLLITIF